MNGIFAIAFKDLKLLFRDKGSLFWVLAFPLIMAMLFGAIFSGEGSRGKGSIPVGLVDEDGGVAAAELIERLSKSESIKVLREISVGEQIRALTFEEAKERVRKGSLVAYFRIQKGYSENRGIMTGNPAKIEVGIDPSRRAEEGFLQGILMDATFGSMQEKFSNPAAFKPAIQDAIVELEQENDMDPMQRVVLASFLKSFAGFLENVDPDVLKEGMNFDGPSIQPVEREKRINPASAFEISFPQALIWGLLGIVGTFAPLIARERHIGTLMRLKISPLSWAQVLGGKGLATFLACVSVLLILLVFGKVVFSVRLGDGLHLAMALIAIGICFTGLMMLVSNCGKTESAVGGASWAVMMPMAMFGGGMVPLIAMPQWMVTASHFSPVKWGIYSMEGAIWRQFSTTEMLLPCAVLFGIGLISFYAGVWLLSRREH